MEAREIKIRTVKDWATVWHKRRLLRRDEKRLGRKECKQFTRTKRRKREKSRGKERKDLA